MNKCYIEGVVSKKLQYWADDRGSLIELFRVDELGSDTPIPKMAYLSVTLPKVTRGPHEHQWQTDVFVFLGEFEVYLWDNREASSTFDKHSSFIALPGTQLVVPPGVVHAYRNPSSNEARMVANAPDQLYAGWNKKGPVDEIRHEDLVESPFKVVTND